MSLLELNGLTKTYGDTTVVRGVDLSVRNGQVLGLLGPNGAGKTTTISMIAGLTEPSSGTAIIAGHDIRTDTMRARAALGLVPQELALYEDLDADQNLAFFGSLYGLRGKELVTRSDWALDIAGLRARAREPVSNFSGGMKRRLNLSIGLLHKPKVLLLDEPTVGVDPQSRNHIFESIRALRDEHSMTIVYCSHYMEEVQQLCEEVAIMDGGCIKAHDRVDALLARDERGSLEIQFEGDAETLRAAVARHGEATVVGDVLRITSSGEFSAILVAIEEAGIVVRSMRTLENNLESLFLTLTGHQLRDD